MDKVTIVIPTYNRVSLLKQALGSALRQTYQNLEILVVDNASVDDTPLYLASVKDVRLKVIRNQKNIYPHKISSIMEHVNGTYSMFLSDDDWLEPTFVEEIITFWSRNPECKFVHAGCTVERQGGSLAALHFPAIQDGKELVLRFFLQKGGPSLCGTLFQVCDIQERGKMLDGDYICDAPLWTSLALSGKVGFIDKPLSHYRLHSNNAFVSADIWHSLRDYRETAERCIKTAAARKMPAQYRKELKAAAALGCSSLTSSLLTRRAFAGSRKLDLLRDLWRCRGFLNALTTKQMAKVFAIIVLPSHWLRSLSRFWNRSSFKASDELSA
jgi:glycosyltransferase involved in cell wall biosynthesis